MEDASPATWPMAKPSISTTPAGKPSSPASDAPNDAVWFRQTFQVPARSTAMTSPARASGSSSTPTPMAPCPRFSTSTAAAWRLGDDLEPIVLFDHAKPGDKVIVAVKLLHTVDKKTFRGATLRIDFPESRPNPEDLRLEFLSAALLVPSLAPE